jgi:hypothetical protein
MGVSKPLVETPYAFSLAFGPKHLTYGVLRPHDYSIYLG